MLFIFTIFPICTIRTSPMAPNFPLSLLSTPPWRLPQRPPRTRVTLPYHTTYYHTKPYHITSYHTIPHLTIPTHTKSYHTISSFPLSTPPLPLPQMSSRVALSSTSSSGWILWMHPSQNYLRNYGKAIYLRTCLFVFWFGLRYPTKNIRPPLVVNPIHLKRMFRCSPFGFWTTLSPSGGRRGKG